MITVEEFLDNNRLFEEANNTHLKEIIVKFAKEAIKEAIKADRLNLLKHIQLSFVPSDGKTWKEKIITRQSILEFYNPKEEDEDWAYEQLKERDGFVIEIDENSLLNAPNIELL